MLRHGAQPRGVALRPRPPPARHPGRAAERARPGAAAPDGMGSPVGHFPAPCLRVAPRLAAGRGPRAMTPERPLRVAIRYWDAAGMSGIKRYTFELAAGLQRLGVAARLSRHLH